MNAHLLRTEIRANIREILYRFIIIGKLLFRFVVKKNLRTPAVSYPEYDNYWASFWNNRDIFRKLPILYYDNPIHPQISPFLARKMGIGKILAQKIEQYEFKSVLEVGSGAGLNLLMLAPLFPDALFVGLEPTESGVRISTEFSKAPPPEFEEAFKKGKVDNIKILKGSILEREDLKQLRDYKFDFVFTSAVLEQLHNYSDICFGNIFDQSNGYFLFFEEWLEANYLILNYKTLVDCDYFRMSWNYLNRFPDIEILERSIPPIQPSWLKYGVVFCRKSTRRNEKCEDISHLTPLYFG